jgi:hypothetical protein
MNGFFGRKTKKIPYSYRSGKPERNPIRRYACDYNICRKIEKNKIETVQAV